MKQQLDILITHKKAPAFVHKALVMRQFLLLALISFSIQSVSGQVKLEEYSLRRIIKQDNRQFQFKVLDEDNHGVWFYNRNKFYYWFKAQRVLSTQGASSGRLLHGDFESFYADKQLAHKGSFYKGLKHGEWLYWREDGTLSFSQEWNHGVQRGKQIIYDTIGNVLETTKVNRTHTEREKQDSLIITQNRGGKELVITFDERGNVLRREERRYGELDGHVRIYENGKIISKEKYIDGILEVDEEESSKTADGETTIDSEQNVETNSSEEEKEPFFKRIFVKREKKEKTPKEKKKTSKKEK